LTLWGRYDFCARHQIPLRNLGAAAVWARRNRRIVSSHCALFSFRSFFQKTTAIGAKNDLSLDCHGGLADMRRSTLGGPIFDHFSPSPAIGAPRRRNHPISLLGGTEKIATVGRAFGRLRGVFCMISGIARIAPFFSLAEARALLTRPLGHERSGCVLKARLTLPAAMRVLPSIASFRHGLIRIPIRECPLTSPEAAQSSLSREHRARNNGCSAPGILIVDDTELVYWRGPSCAHFHFIIGPRVSDYNIILSNHM